MHHLKAKFLSVGLVAIWFIVGCTTPQPTPIPSATEPSPRIQTTMTQPAVSDGTFSEEADRATTASSEPATSEPNEPESPVIGPTETTPTDDWTLLIYMDADNNLEPYALADLDEIASAVGGLQNVNVVVQVDRAAGYATSAENDWTDARRFATDNGQWAEIESLGEIEMGDTQTLADFLTWGIGTYPAQHTALIMWGHGSGWLGMSTDGPLGASGLSLTHLETALQNGLASTDVSHLDLIGFDACLMGQLDVFATVQNYADVAVASADLIPGNGWDYAGLLTQLAIEPADDGAQLGAAIVETFQDYYAADGVQNVTLAAVDLTRIGAVTDALDQLATVMLDNLAVHAPIIGDGRQGGGRLATNYGKSQDAVGAVDFGRFAAILAQLSPDPTLRTAAQQTVVAIENAVIVSQHGSEIAFSEGIGLYFPNRPNAYNAAYPSATAVEDWSNLLNAFYALDLPAPNLTITGSPEPNTEINHQNPAFLSFELAGQQIDEVALVIGRVLEDGRQLLLEYDRLVPEPTMLPDGSQLAAWRDGVHSDFFVWDTEVTYLTDGTQGDFVVMWPTTPNSTRFAVHGLYSFANGSDSVPAAMLFDHRTRTLAAVWGGDINAPAEITPQAGDQFQPYRWLIDGDNFIPESGETLAVDTLTYSNRPVEGGDYFMGFRATSITGALATAQVDLQVGSDNLEADVSGYLDPYLGFQFLYPDEWIRPIYGEYGSTLLYTSNPSSTISFQVKLYRSDALAVGEQAIPLSAEAIRADALNQWPNISLLYEDTTTVAGEIAVQTVYGYRTAEEQRTGIFYTFVHDGAGYLVDIDMPTSNEERLIEMATRLLNSWTFQPVGIGLDPSRWSTLILDDAELLIPAGYVYEPLENGWERYRREQRADTFFAFRRDVPTGRTSAELAAAWIGLASQGLNNVEVAAPEPFPLAGRGWVRHNFTYTADNGTPIAGFLLTSLVDEEAVLWAEAPADQWDDYAKTVLLLASREFRQK